jgi:hypothetical protein
VIGDWCKVIRGDKQTRLFTGGRKKEQSNPLSGVSGVVTNHESPLTNHFSVLLSAIGYSR